jgi:yibE/F family protein
MGAGHSHGAADVEHVAVGAAARKVLIGFLTVVAFLTVAGLIWLWPSPSQVSHSTMKQTDAPGMTFVHGTITDVQDGCATAQGGHTRCSTATVRVTTGEDEGQSVSVELLGPFAYAGLRAGDDVELGRIDTPNGVLWSFSAANRTPALIGMVLLFVVVVVAVARWKGLFALLGLAFSGFVLVGFMMPALITGKPGMIVALVGGTAILFVVLYVAHGVSLRTSTALAGTLLGLAVTTGLGAISVELARLSGFADESEYDLATVLPGLDLRQLLMVGIIVGGLGVLNDVTITQSSSVWELRAAAPSMSRRKLFAAGMRIGRDHIASTIYTIVFAYAGGSLAVLLLLFFTNRNALDLLNVEMFAGEIVRTLGSAIGLVLSVPITTGIAALVVAPSSSEAPAQAESASTSAA